MSAYCKVKREPCLFSRARMQWRSPGEAWTYSVGWQVITSNTWCRTTCIKQKSWKWCSLLLTIKTCHGTLRSASYKLNCSSGFMSPRRHRNTFMVQYKSRRRVTSSHCFFFFNRNKKILGSLPVQCLLTKTLNLTLKHHTTNRNNIRFVLQY